MAEGKLIALWEAGKHPRDWWWFTIHPESQRLNVADNEAYLYAVTYGPSGWTLAREDGVEAEVYVPL